MLDPSIKVSDNWKGLSLVGKPNLVELQVYVEFSTHPQRASGINGRREGGGVSPLSKPDENSWRPTLKRYGLSKRFFNITMVKFEFSTLSFPSL